MKGNKAMGILRGGGMILCLLAFCCEGAESLFNRMPEWKAPFAANQAPGLDSEFIVNERYDNWRKQKVPQAGFHYGNRVLGVYQDFSSPEIGSHLTLHIDRVYTGLFVMTGGFRNYKSHDWAPFSSFEGEAVEVGADPVSKSILWRRPYRLPDGGRAVCSWQLKRLDSRRVELSWDAGITREQADHFGGFYLYPRFATYPKGVFKAENLSFDDRLLTRKSFDELQAIGGKRQISEFDKVAEFVYAPDSPRRRFSVHMKSFNCKVEETVNPALSATRAVVRLIPDQMPVKDSVIFEFGPGFESAAAAAPPPVEGVDFWKYDAMHVPLAVTANRVMNPGFEQEGRYWALDLGVCVNENYSCEIVKTDETLFGEYAARLRSDGKLDNPDWLIAHPVALPPDAIVTVSYYAKGKNGGELLAAGVNSPNVSGKFGWIKRRLFPQPQSLTKEWKRYEFTVRNDRNALRPIFRLVSSGEVWIDNVQMEIGDKATEFVKPPVEARLVTRERYNNLTLGEAPGAELHLTGEPGLKGEVALELFNYYREKPWSGTFHFTLDRQGVAVLKLDMDPGQLGQGVFALKARFQVDGKAFFDFYRMSVLKPLAGKHATRDLFGLCLGGNRVQDKEYLFQLIQRSGFGSYVYGGNDVDDPAGLNPIARKYGLRSYGQALTYMYPRALPLADVNWCRGILKRKQISPADEARIEELAFQAVKNNPSNDYWAFANEEEGATLIRDGNFEEWAKVLTAFAKGARRARPDVKLMPTTGPQRYCAIRGRREMEGYIRSTLGKVKWDAFSIHMYQTLDGTNGWEDIETEIIHLAGLLKKYGYAGSGILIPEFMNVPYFYCPPWGSLDWNDDFRGSRPSYDFSHREFMHAAWVARASLIGLKYPQVRHMNPWIGANRIFDGFSFAMSLTPKGINTLGLLFDDISYVSDIRPSGDIRGYLFRDNRTGEGVAAIWSTNQDAESGTAPGPRLRVKFARTPEFIDFMGNARRLAPDGKGNYDIQLYPAPFFIRGKDSGAMAKEFAAAEPLGSRFSIRTFALPQPDGGVSLKTRNLTGTPQKTVFGVEDWKTEVVLEPFQDTLLPVSRHEPASGKMFRWNKQISVSGGSDKSTVDWEMDYFYAPYTSKPLPLDPEAPEWEAVPALEISNLYLLPKMKDRIKHGHTGDIGAKYRVAWDERNLYLMVEATDDQFVPMPIQKESALYDTDGCLEVYIDAGANGREKGGYDDDDYRYDFARNHMTNQDGPASVWRLREPNIQNTDAQAVISKEAAAKNLRAVFKRTADGYRYVVIFEQKYLQPFVLKEGGMCGFALFLHDRDSESEPQGLKGISTAARPGAHCDYHPEFWPLMILKK